MTFRKAAAKKYPPQVKICGLTRAEEAAACVELGARGIGCVFYPPSPRNVTEQQARTVCRALSSQACTLVGVFVDESFGEIMRKVEKCGLDAVQLHGRESPDLVNRLSKEGLRVIKGLFVNAAPSFDAASDYRAYAYLAECAGGPLPGGNALNWNWDAATEVSSKFPLILAGGLNPDNVSEAISAACPDAVDVSSGVEADPGRKDLNKVKRFLEAVSRSGCTRNTGRIF